MAPLQRLTTREREVLALLAELQRRLRRGAYHVLHFVGHGGFNERRQDGELLLEDEERLSYRISGQDLGMLLHDHRSLRLVVLNACRSAQVAAGLVQSLGLPAAAILRNVKGEQIRIKVNYPKIVKGKHENIPVHPGDTIIVP